MVPGRPLSQTHDRRGTLTVSVETGAHQHDPKNHHTAAEQWRNAVWSLFGSLHLQVSQGCTFLVCEVVNTGIAKPTRPSITRIAPMITIPFMCSSGQHLRYPRRRKPGVLSARDS